MYNKKEHVHFIGIGGIGMSGIATILKQQGYRISGCDKDINQKSVLNLKALGCEIYEGNNSVACQHPSIDIVVYSSAIHDKNQEIVLAQQRGIPTIPRATMLAELMRMKYSIAIAGSHGKTTTTSLISHILIEAQQDPTVIIGGHLKALSSNARLGNGDFLVAEADESDRSLLQLKATLAVVTNIDLEHLETYKDLDDIRDTFARFLNNLPFYGKAILCADDPTIQSLLPLPHIKTILYGLTARADWYASALELLPDTSSFALHYKDQELPLARVNLEIPGSYNIQNALGAIALTYELGVPLATIINALATFKGVERRFSYHGVFKGAEFFDDYGHHPTEIKHVLEVARRRAKKNLIVVFQPHRYTRTHQLWQQFMDAFLSSNSDHLILTDIYPASEAPIPGVTSKQLCSDLKMASPAFSAEYIPYDASFTALCNALAQKTQNDDLVLLLGAGRINLLPGYLK